MEVKIATKLLAILLLTSIIPLVAVGLIGSDGSRRMWIDISQNHSKRRIL